MLKQLVKKIAHLTNEKFDVLSLLGAETSSRPHNSVAGVVHLFSRVETSEQQKKGGGGKGRVRGSGQNS